VKLDAVPVLSSNDFHALPFQRSAYHDALLPLVLLANVHMSLADKAATGPLPVKPPGTSTCCQLLPFQCSTSVASEEWR
jgi:hypothetical protein